MKAALGLIALVTVTAAARGPARRGPAAKTSAEPKVVIVFPHIAPEVMSAWLTHANQVQENPPYLHLFKGGPNFPPPACGPGVPAKERPGLKRKCIIEDYVTPADQRLAADATPAHRIAILKHFLQVYHLPGYLKQNRITESALIEKGGGDRPGANDVNASIGMARYQLFLEEQAAIDMAKAQTTEGKAAGADDIYASSVRMSAIAVAELFHRQRRLLDFWFPDAPAWTAALVDACARDEKTQDLPWERCCFREFNGCVPHASVAVPPANTRRVPASHPGHRHGVK